MTDTATPPEPVEGAEALDPEIAALLKRDTSGLITAVVQEEHSGDVLMVGWMDDLALHRTLTTGRSTFYSRSRREYWVKGETSGHRQWVREVRLDCDGDTVLIKVRQEGGACHTGDHSCFDARVLPAVVTSEVGPAMSASAVTPSLEEFRRQATDRRVIPVYRRLLADAETAIGLYRKLAQNRSGSYLLESAEQGVWSRYSFIGVNAAATLTERGGEAVWTGHAPAGLPSGGDPLAALRETLRLLHTPAGRGLPPFTSGLVGFLSYDAVRRVERLPDGNVDDLELPELAFLLASDLAVLDHHDGEVWLVANAINFDDSDERVDEAYADAVSRVEAMTELLARPTPSSVVSAAFGDQTLPIRRQRTPEQFQGAVAAAVEEIKAGEAFQIVVSQRFEVDTTADALDIYRVLRLTNPSPYMYLLRLTDKRGREFDIVGSLAGGTGHGQGRHSRHPSDRRLQAARRDAARGRGPRGGAARRPQGTVRARDARRPGPQRSGPGLPAGHGRGDRVHGGPPLQPHHASGIHRRRPDRRRPLRTRRGARRLPGRHPVRRAQGAGDGDHRRARGVPPRALRRRGRLSGLRR